MKTQKEGTQNLNPEFDIDVGKHEVMIGKRYGFLYTLNDILIALWFIAGSILFFWDVTQETGTWFFLVGSIELLVRPFIRISRNTHLKRIRS